VAARVRLTIQGLHHQCRDLQPIDLPLPLKSLGSNISSSGIIFQVSHEVFSCAFYLLFVFLPSSMKKTEKSILSAVL
jgi:hypothetical protein